MMEAGTLTIAWKEQHNLLLRDKFEAKLRQVKRILYITIPM